MHGSMVTHINPLPKRSVPKLGDDFRDTKARFFHSLLYISHHTTILQIRLNEDNLQSLKHSLNVLIRPKVSLLY